jgi:hypothetical protein
MSSVPVGLSSFNSMRVEKEDPVVNPVPGTPDGWKAKCVNQCLIVFDPDGRTAVIKTLNEPLKDQEAGLPQAEWSEGMDLAVLQRLCWTALNKKLDLKAPPTTHHKQKK